MFHLPIFRAQPGQDRNLPMVKAHDFHGKSMGELETTHRGNHVLLCQSYVSFNICFYDFLCIDLCLYIDVLCYDVIIIHDIKYNDITYVNIYIYLYLI